MGRGLPNPQELRSSPAFMARVAGVLFLSGVLLVVLATLLPHPESTDERGIVAVAVLAGAVGTALIAGARRARPWTIQAAIATGSVLVCACIYFSGVATGVFSTMFIWVVLVSSFFFPGRGALAQLAFLLAAYAAVLLAVPSHEYSAFTRWLLSAVALGVAWAVTSWLVHGLRGVAERVDERRVQAESMALTDELTGLPNRRWLHEELAREISRAARDGTAVWLALIDFDRFKDFNDRLGHAAGDELLRQAADDWRSAIRASDFLARYGGEEFVLLVPGCSREEATVIVERLRAATPLKQTCSAGLTAWNGAESAPELIARADHALYEAKRKGRDRTIVEGGGPRAIVTAQAG